MAEVDLVTAMDAEITKRARVLERLEAYFEGRQALRFLAPFMEDRFGQECAQLVLNWPRIVTEAYDERSDIEGFRYAGDSAGDEGLWDIWQANDGDEQAPQAHLESLIGGVSYAIVGTRPEGGPPIITVEHGAHAIVRRNPATRAVREGLKRWQDVDDDGHTVHWANLYLDGATVTYRKSYGSKGWQRDSEPDEHGCPPLIVPVVNRGRLRVPDGRSEFADVIPVADAANKIVTDMMTSAEYHAMPRRWATGLTEEDFVDENGKALSTWENIAGRLWASDKGPDEVAFGQFQEADLLNFHNTIRLLAQLTSQLAGLPQSYMSFTSDNPASADAIRAEEARFVKRCERKHVAWGGAWEQVMRLAIRVDSGQELDAGAKALETLWRDPATPTKAQQADATVKLVQAGIIPVEQAREDLGYTSEQRARMAEMDEKAARTDPLSALADQFRAPTAAPAPEQVSPGVPA